MTKRLLISCCFLYAWGFTGYTQSINRLKLDSLFNTLSENNLAMASIAISKNGVLVYQRSTGAAFTGADKQVPASENTEYRIGSISKMFTATIFFQLIEEKKLSINDTLSRYFPSLPNAGRITMSNLLYHRSGLPDFTKGTNFNDWMDKPKTHDELLALVAGRPADFEPNAKADYNNSNYLVLGYIIEKVCGKPYKEVLNERIISRLGLTKTWYGNGTDSTKNECASYRFFDNKWIRDKAVSLDNFCGAGAIVSAPSDMVKFIEALFSYKLVSKASLDKMKTMVDDYGMGIFPYAFQSKKGYGHNGKTEGFASSLSYYPDEKLAIAFCTNGEVYPKADILNGVLSICFGAVYTIPSFKPLAVNSRDLEKYTGTYLSSQPPIKVVCTKTDSNLLLETNGHTFVLNAIAGNQFMNPQFGFFFDFNPAGKQLLIKESDEVYYLDKQL